MHDSDDYGILYRKLKEIAEAVGCPQSLVNELASKGVLKGCDTGKCEPFIYRPRHANREGDPVVLIEKQDGPIWYSSRMVRDEHIRQIRTANAINK